MNNIIIWKPTETLKCNIKKINTNQYNIVGVIANENDYGLLKKKFDYIIISFENYKMTRKILENDFDISSEKILTFEEFWVLGCEEKINEKYLMYWKQWNGGLFKDKRVCIIGGGSGIGKETAIAYKYAGAEVIIAGRNENKLKKVSKKYGFKYMCWDITDVKNNDKMIKKITQMIGADINIVVNCAGIWSGDNFFEVTEEEYDSILDTNLKGAYFLCQSFAKYYIERHIKGRIVNVISNVGFLPTVKPYGISKWGLVGLTKGLGMNLAEYGIIVNGIAPGSVATEELAGWSEGDCPARRNSKIGRIAFPSEVAQQILMLSSFMGDNMPGEVVVFDGGDKTFGLRY